VFQAWLRTVIKNFFALYYVVCITLFLFINRYLPVREDLNEKEQARQGGNVVGCDQCNLHYCATCSAKMNKPVERHRGETCAESQRFGNKDCRLHRLYILDEICLLRCPRCKTVKMKIPLLIVGPI